MSSYINLAVGLQKVHAAPRLENCVCILPVAQTGSFKKHCFSIRTHEFSSETSKKKGDSF